MDFSDLVEAINRNDKAKTNALLKELTPRLVRFLQVHMNADQQDAEDCVQQTLLKSLEAMREDNIRDKERVLSFLLSTSRNTYLNLMKKKKEASYEEYPRTFGHQPRQLLTLLDEERRKVLEWCMDQLPDDYRKFIDYWFNYPDTDATAVASHFEISVNNAWTRKHRIVKKLNECYEEKSSE